MLLAANTGLVLPLNRSPDTFYNIRLYTLNKYLIFNAQESGK